MVERQARSKKEIWRKDVTQIKALGFNTMRAWIDWASGRAGPRSSKASRRSTCCWSLPKKRGYKLVLQVYMDSAPQWVGEQFPDSHVRLVEWPGPFCPKSSPGYCRDHMGVRAADNAFYAALAAPRTAQPCLSRVGPLERAHVINWANPTSIPNPEFCFCPHTIGRFRRWLQAKYG